MSSLFQRLFSGEEEAVDEREAVAEAYPLADENTSPELRSDPEPVQAVAPDLGSGLIPASNLPSAANSLAELFREEPAFEEARALEEIEQPPEQALPPTPAPAASPSRRRGMLARLFTVKRQKRRRISQQTLPPVELDAALPGASPAEEAHFAETANEVLLPSPEVMAAELILVDEPRSPESDSLLAIDESPAHEELPVANAMEETFEWAEVSAREELSEPPQIIPEDWPEAPGDVAVAVPVEAMSEVAPESVADADQEINIDELILEIEPKIENQSSAHRKKPVQIVTDDLTLSESVIETQSDPQQDPQPEPQPEYELEVSSPVEFAPAADAPALLAETAPAPAAAPRIEIPEPRRPYKDWAFDEKLASHIEWLNSHGASGKRADLSGAELEATELISVNLRLADLHDANLRGSDLLLTDLREACLVRADLEETSLVGANLEGANLEGASLETAMGLVPRQLAGANLRDAQLAPHLMEFEAVPAFERASENAFRYFTAMTSLSVLSWLLIWRTKDIQLLTDSAILSFLHSRAAATALPTAESYLIIPVGLFVLYLIFHFHLQHMWDAVAELPAVFPDGHTLGERGPGIVSGLLRAHFRWMNPDPSSTRLVEKAVCLLTAYWVVPGTLLLFWLRYLTRQDIHGTLLHVLLTVASAAIAFYITTKVGRPHQAWQFENKWSYRLAKKVKAISPLSLGAVAGAALLFLSVGTIFGVPHERTRAPQYRAISIRRWAPDVLWYLSFDPYADLTENTISRKPSGAPISDDQVASVDGLWMNNANFRYAQAYGAFLANAHLWHADLQGAFLSDADLRNVDLGESNLHFSVMDHAQMAHVNLYRAYLDGADLRRADLHDANLSYSSLQGSILVDAQLDSANLYAAHLTGATLTRADLQKADLRESFMNVAHMDHVDLRNAYLWSAKITGADLGAAQLQNAILIGADMRGANLGGAYLTGTVLNDADISGTSLEGADLRGALGLTSNQICSARSRRGALLDDSLETQVEAQCGPSK